MVRKRHREDSTRYAELLESTRGDDNVCHRDQAVKLLTAELQADAGRVAEYAEARALEVADGFDRTHQPETDGGQLALDIDTFLVIGESERVAVDLAEAEHTRRWLEVSAAAHARAAAAWSAKDMHGRKLLAIQDEHSCSMWAAELILRGAA